MGLLSLEEDVFHSRIESYVQILFVHADGQGCVIHKINRHRLMKIDLSGKVKKLNLMRTEMVREYR